MRISFLASCSTGPRGAILDKAEKDLLTPASNCDYTWYKRVIEECTEMDTYVYWKKDFR